MTSEHPFDLEPTGASPGNEDLAPGEAELDWREREGAAPRRRRRKAGRPARRSRSPGTHLTKEGSPGKLGRLLGWIVAPTFYYLLGFFSLVALILALFNPVFGVVSRQWPHEVLGLGDSPFVWGPDAARATTLLATLLGYVIALLMRPGPGRGVVVVLGTAISWLAFQPEPSVLGYFMLPIVVALVAGALFSSGGTPRSRRRTRQLLFVGLVLLGAQLFLPWDPGRLSRQRVEQPYVSTMSSTIDLYMNPPWDFLQETDSGYLELIGLHLPATAAALMWLLGLLALLGLGRRWVRWAAGILLLILYFGVAWRFYGHGPSDPLLYNLDKWQIGAAGWAEHWYSHALAYALPFAAGCSEMLKGRST